MLYNILCLKKFRIQIKRLKIDKQDLSEDKNNCLYYFLFLSVISNFSYFLLTIINIYNMTKKHSILSHIFYADYT